MTAMNFKGQQGQGKHGGSWDTTDDGEWHYWWFWFRQLKEAFYNFVLSFFCPSPLPFGGSTVLSLARGPAGNRTTTGSLSATSRTPRYQLSHEDDYNTQQCRFVWWLDCLLLKEGASAFCSLRWEFAGFRAGGRLPFEWLYWILCCPLLGPLAPLDSYRSFQRRKNMNYDLFSQSCQISWVRGGMVEKRANRGKKEF